MLCYYSTVITSRQLHFSLFSNHRSITEVSRQANPAPSTGLASLTLMDLVLALDAGTTGVRAVAYSPTTEAVATAYRELTQYFPEPGQIEHDAAEIAALSVETLREVAHELHARGDRVVAVGIANQRETTVAFDRERATPLHRALVWQDRRTAPQCDALRLAGHEPRIRATTGLVIDPYFAATKMAWLLERGVLDGALAPTLGTIDTWLLWWLSGNVESGVLATEPSNAARTLLMDLNTLDWSPTMASIFGVPLGLLAPIRPSASNFGFIDRSVLPELAGVPVSAMLGDQQAALFGQAGFSAGVVKATYGTGAFVMANAGTSIPDVVDGLLTTVAWDLGAFGPATYALEGSAFVAGAAIQWLRDELHVIAASSDLEPLARRVEDSAGVQVVPAFTGLGSPFWRSDARGSIVGLSQATGRAHIARALVEAIAHQVRAMFDAFASSGLVLRELRADGGASSMDLLLELQAAGCRVPVVRSASLEATARGAGTLAGLSGGLWPSLESLEDEWRSDRRFEPSEPSAIDNAYRSWLRAVERA